MRVTLVDHMGSDLSVVNAARVSYAKHSAELDNNDKKLIQYLAKHGHWSPFAHAFLQFRIAAPLFVARQLAKHQVGLSWNEVSRRYVDDEPELYEPKHWRGRPTNSKQGSDGLIEDASEAHMCLGLVHDTALECYNELLELGVAPEMARAVLPQTMMTEWYWSGSLHAFARVCKQRLDPHSQEETQEVAAMIYQNCQKLFPNSWVALNE